MTHDEIFTNLFYKREIYNGSQRTFFLISGHVRAKAATC